MPGDDTRGELNLVFGPEHRKHRSIMINTKSVLPADPISCAGSVDSLIEQETQRWSLPGEVKCEKNLSRISADRFSQRVRGETEHREPAKRSGKNSEEISPTMPTSNISILEPYRDQRTSTLPYLSLFALLILFFSLATAFQYAYPAVFDSWIKKVPLIGPVIARNNLLKERVALQSCAAVIR